MRNIFLEKSCTKCDGETSPRRFFEKLKLSISLDELMKVFYCLFLLYTELRATETFWNLAAEHFLSPNIKLFKKIKRGIMRVSLPHFPHIFKRKIFLLLYSINWPSFIVSLLLLREILGSMCIVKYFSSYLKGFQWSK